MVEAPLRQGFEGQAKKSNERNCGNSKIKLPPKNFPSGRLWISKKIIKKMTENIIKYLHQNGNKYNTKIVYARGSYLEATKLASQKSGIEVREIFTENELAGLKKKGIMWMKVGLRMSESFEIFKKRIRGLARVDARKQLSLFL